MRSSDPEGRSRPPAGDGLEAGIPAQSFGRLGRDFGLRGARAVQIGGGGILLTGSLIVSVDDRFVPDYRVAPSGEVTTRIGGHAHLLGVAPGQGITERGTGLGETAAMPPARAE